MNIESELILLGIVKDDIENMKEFLDLIHKKLGDKPATIQLEFIKPLKHILMEMLGDLNNPEDDFLNQEHEPTKV